MREGIESARGTGDVSIAALLLAAALAAAPVAAETPKQPKASGIESKGYSWSAATPEQAKILRLKGDPGRGRVSYEVCQGCHKPDGSGRDDGSYPQLAGQHVSVLIKQMADIRAGRRDNPKMYPFSGEHLLSGQEIADIAAYLQSLPIPHHNGRGPGQDLARGRQLYDKDCATCHGANGEGSAAKFYPVLAGQHFRYLLRQTQEIRDGKRRNANERMVRVARKYDDAQVAAVADYMSRLVWPERSGPGK